MDGKVDMNTDYNGAGDDEDERVLEWEDGLPTTDDLTPLSQSLIPPELASAFSISPEPSRTTLDVQRASQTTMSSLRRQNPPPSSSPSLKALNSYPSTDSAQDDPTVIEGNETAGAAGDRAAGFEPSSHRSSQRTAAMEDSDYVAGGAENSVDDPSSRASKRPRLAWTPQLHKRFVEVVAHLGIKNAVPKTIMQLMNVEGLTRENVASHLQKYRLYLKRMQGISDDGPSSSDHLLTSTQSPREPPAPMPVLYAAARPQMIPMPVMGMAAHHSHGHGGQHMGMMPSGGLHPYPVFPDRPSEWPRGNRYGSALPFRRGVPTDK